MSLTLLGVTQMQRALREIAMKMPDRVGSALYMEAQIEMTEAKRRTPVEFGILKASGFVGLPERTWSGIVFVVLSFGGAAEDYAVIVHEDLTAFHPHGQAKYLESVLLESRPFMAARIAKRLAF